MGILMAQKMDVLDMIIDTLKEHEKIMDELIERLEAITPTLEKEMNK